jgi:hypothetical protein
MNNIIDRIDKEIDDIIIMDDYDGGKVSGLRAAREILINAQADGPRYFGTKDTSDTPMN